MTNQTELVNEREIINETELPFSLKFDRFFSKPVYRKSLDAITIGFFVLVIIGPIIFIFLTILLNIPSIQKEVFNDKLLGDLKWQMMLQSLIVSFIIAAIAVAIDLIIAFPTAIILTRYNFKGKESNFQ